jgi:hypothetical protein
MEEATNQGWMQEGRFYGFYSGYTVQGLKYSNARGETAWHTTSWPKRDPIHDFWVSGKNFHRVAVHPVGVRAIGSKIEVFEVVEDVATSERKAVLEAIQAWEKVPQWDINLQPPH